MHALSSQSIGGAGCASAHSASTNHFALAESCHEWLRKAWTAPSVVDVVRAYRPLASLFDCRSVDANSAYGSPRNERVACVSASLASRPPTSAAIAPPSAPRRAE